MASTGINEQCAAVPTAADKSIAAAIGRLCVWLSLLGLSACASRVPVAVPKIAETGEYSRLEGRSAVGFSGGYPQRVNLDFLNYDELVALSESGHPGSDTALGAKVDRLLSSPLIDNRAWYSGGRPQPTVSSKLGPMVSCATWNIEKSLHMPAVIAAMQSEEAYAEMIDAGVVEGSHTWHEMMRQRARVSAADVLFLQEMDIGVNRSDYADAAGELARAMKMNYAYATQAIEVDPVLLGREAITNHETGEIDVELTNFFRADPARFKGCFGTAVLSRYPIKHAEVIPLKTVGYDWYAGEKEKTTFVEDLRRVGTKIVFDNTVTREMKVGGRHYFRVDLDVPGCGRTNTLTVINVHLEIMCEPKVRDAQIREILGYVHEIPNPVVMAGDFNASAIDVSPTSIPRITTRLAKNPETWLNLANEFIFDIDSASLIRNALNFTKNLHSPLAPNIPVVLPNKVRPLIDEMHEFRFGDGSTFDFRGDPERSMGMWHGALSNSNQKQLKGQVQTFSVRRPIGPVGYYRLDWMFVKSGLLNRPRQPDGSYVLAPHFGETLRVFNHHLKVPFSDHRPSVVDLPLTEPAL